MLIVQLYCSDTLIISIVIDYSFSVSFISIFKCKMFGVGDCAATALYNVLSRIQLKCFILISLLISASFPSDLCLMS